MTLSTWGGSTHVKMQCVCLWFSLSACVGGSETPCHRNGMCDGDGTRGGDGKCSCNQGYEGEVCLDCIEGYFSEVRNDTSLCTGTGSLTCPQPLSNNMSGEWWVNLFGLHFLPQNATLLARPAPEEPVRTVMSVRTAGRRTTRKLVSVRKDQICI